MLCNHLANKFVSKMLKSGTFLQFSSPVPHMRKSLFSRVAVSRLCLLCLLRVYSVSTRLCWMWRSRLSRQQIAVFHGGVLSYYLISTYQYIHTFCPKSPSITHNLRFVCLSVCSVNVVVVCHQSRMCWHYAYVRLVYHLLRYFGQNLQHWVWKSTQPSCQDPPHPCFFKSGHASSVFHYHGLHCSLQHTALSPGFLIIVTTTYRSNQSMY